MTNWQPLTPDDNAQTKELSMYRVAAVVDGQIRLLACVGWSKRDVQEKLKIRMRTEGRSLGTLSFLDRRPLTMPDQQAHTPPTPSIYDIRDQFIEAWAGDFVFGKVDAAKYFDRALDAHNARIAATAKVEAYREAQQIIAGDMSIEEQRSRIGADKIDAAYLIQEFDIEIQDLLEGSHD